MSSWDSLTYTGTSLVAGRHNVCLGPVEVLDHHTHRHFAGDNLSRGSFITEAVVQKADS
jgi:hypothetical protein